MIRPTFPCTRRASRARPMGYTLLELLIASSLSSMVGIGLVSLAIMAGRLDRSISRQQLCLHEAQVAIEGINSQIRQATANLRIIDANGQTALQGNRVEFSFPGDAANWTRAIELVSSDDNPLTPWDNQLIYDPNISQAGDEIAFARWLTPLVQEGAFTYSGAKSPLVVQMRAGDPTANGQNTTFISGPGRQGVEVNIAVSPRN